MNELQRILQAVEHCHQAGKRAVLATVVHTQGSVYRKPGARMLVIEDGWRVGAISGGCLEGDIVERSRSLLSADSEPILVRYDTTSDDDIVFGLGLGCSGIVDVLLEPLNRPAAREQMALMQACFNTQKPGAIATVFAAHNVPDVSVGDRLIIQPDGTFVSAIANPHAASALIADLMQILVNRQTLVQSYPIATGHLEVLLEVICPPVPLLIFGAGYDALPVVQFAKQLGWQVTVLDHRPDYLTRDCFSHADHLLSCAPDNLQTYGHLLTPQTAAVVMTHHYLSDLGFLKHLIPAQLRYLGVLGPKHRMQQLWHDLAEYGIFPTDAQSRNFYSPIGLDIGAETPEEIALAIVAEIQAVTRGRSSRFLRDRPGSIHPSHPSPCLELAS